MPLHGTIIAMKDHLTVFTYDYRGFKSKYLTESSDMERRYRIVNNGAFSFQFEEKNKVKN